MIEAATFLLAMKAAGAAIQLGDFENQRKISNLGKKIDQHAIDANLAMVQAQASQESEAAASSLRETMGYQMALSASRGTAAGAGSTLAATQSSQADYERGKQTRRMNLLAREADLRSARVLTGIHQLQSETKLGQKLGQTMVSLISSKEFTDKMGMK